MGGIPFTHLTAKLKFLMNSLYKWESCIFVVNEITCLKLKSSCNKECNHSTTVQFDRPQKLNRNFNIDMICLTCHCWKRLSPSCLWHSSSSTGSPGLSVAFAARIWYPPPIITWRTIK